MCVFDSLMRGTQLVRSGSLAKSNVMSSVVRSASCSRGWLRLLVQSIFAAVTVASFVLIVFMAAKWPKLRPSDRPSRCRINNCKVQCREAPFFEYYEDDINYAVSIAEENCVTIFLTLDSPMFINNTMPPKWLSSLRTNIYGLAILSGNLMHVSSNAFMNQYTASIRILVFHNLVLRSWTADTLLGLSSLRRLYFKDCIIVNVPRHALRAVDSTLQGLTITRSEHWDPTNVTGSTIFIKLTTVDFSFNSFKEVLGSTSFTGLQQCKVLYLNSCRISAIGAGAFDNLHSIEMLFLNNNYLITIPAGLFRNIKTIGDPQPKINLQDNLWHCDCSAKEIRKLITEGMLLTDPSCVTPEYFKYKTFTDLETYCSNENNQILNIIDTNITERASTQLNNSHEIYGVVYVTNECYNGKESFSNVSMKMFSPVYGHGCALEGFNDNGIDSVPSFARSNRNQIFNNGSWINITYFLKTLSYSMVQIAASEKNSYGLVWFQSTCPNEVYCVSDVPSVLRIYNIDLKAHYVFCPIFMSTGRVEREHCVLYQNATFDFEEAYYKLQILHYIATGITCSAIAAICVYALIRKHPNLLKGSKRILFVKHKTVDALVLPPKVPLRNDLVQEPTPDCNEKKIFIVPSNRFSPNKFNRNISTRSSKSSSPSYISALQPTEDQLAEWRIMHHFNNDLSITSMRSEFSTFSWISSDDSVPDVDSEITYESLK